MAQTNVQTTRPNMTMTVATEPGVTADLLTGRRRLLALLRAHRQKRLAAAATTTTTTTTEETANAESTTEGYTDLIDTYNTTITQTAVAGAARARAGFRPGDDNAGLGVSTAAEEKAAEEKKAALAKFAAATAAAPVSTKERRARQLMVAPGSAAHGKLMGNGRKSNGWHSSRKDEAGKNGSSGPAQRSRGYDSSSDEDVGRSAVGRKKKMRT